MQAATMEISSLREVIDKVSLDVRQNSKELESQWEQLRLVIGPAADSVHEITQRKILTQKDENQSLLKKLLEFKKQHVAIKAGIEEMRKQVQEMIQEIG